MILLERETPVPGSSDRSNDFLHAFDVGMWNESSLRHHLPVEVAKMISVVQETCELAYVGMMNEGYMCILERAKIKSKGDK